MAMWATTIWRKHRCYDPIEFDVADAELVRVRAEV